MPRRHRPGYGRRCRRRQTDPRPVDVVFVGDGYTAGELARFHTDVRERWAEIVAVEPYTTYANLFNVWAVDAVSHQSGVSGDPSRDVVRDTALGS